MLAHGRTPYIPFTVTICGVGQPQLRFITGIVLLLGRMLRRKGPSFSTLLEGHTRQRLLERAVKVQRSIEVNQNDCGELRSVLVESRKLPATTAASWSVFPFRSVKIRDRFSTQRYRDVRSSRAKRGGRARS